MKRKRAKTLQGLKDIKEKIKVLRERRQRLPAKVTAESIELPSTSL